MARLEPPDFGELSRVAKGVVVAPSHRPRPSPKALVDNDGRIRGWHALARMLTRSRQRLTAGVGMFLLRESMPPLFSIVRSH
jgi:hypothetical protein